MEVFSNFYAAWNTIAAHGFRLRATQATTARRRVIILRSVSPKRLILMSSEKRLFAALEDDTCVPPLENALSAASERSSCALR